MMKLYPVLFENAEENRFVKALNIFMEKKPNVILTNAIGDSVAFYEANKDKIDNILAGVSNFSFLGAGMNGAVFNLDDRVLKLQQHDVRAKTILKTHETKGKKGLHYPMIYDHGTLFSPTANKPIDYTILEKFETDFNKDNDLRWFIDRMIFSINMKMTLTNRATKKLYTEDEIKEEIKEDVFGEDANQRASVLYPKVTEKLRLKNDWLDRLIEDMFALQKEGILDAQVGGSNLGIRRDGSEGYLVFFD